MKLIKSIEVVHVPEKWRAMLDHFPDVSQEAYRFGVTNVEELCDVRREIINGHKFTNADGEEMNLGLSEDVYNALGLPIDCWEHDQNVIRKLREKKDKAEFENSVMSRRFDEMERASWWRRLMCFIKNDLGELY